ncbi:SCO-spondin-like isoform X1 [Rissa tridactyla]|nr:SCO-spondin-like isoform X1 [Rissa tridactyla]
MWGLLLCGGWLLATGYLAGAAGGCWHQCCPGRNNTCWASGSHRARCYCDSYCERTGDCCEDYRAVCRHAAVGCVVGPWGRWSRCSSLCGVGSKARSRQVTVPPRHGGEPCPDLKQRRGCLGEHPTCGTAKGNAGPTGMATSLVRDCPRCPSRGVFNHPCPPPWLLLCQKWPRYYLTPSARTSGIPGGEMGSCCRRNCLGKAPLPWAGLDPPAAPGQAGVCQVPGRNIPPPSSLHRTWAARSQDILGGCFRGRVPGLVGAGGAAGGLCLPPTSSHLCVVSPKEGLPLTRGADSPCFPLSILLKNGKKTLLIKIKNKGIAKVW